MRGRLEPISNSFQQDTNAAEVQESKEIGRVIFPTNYQSTIPLKPSGSRQGVAEPPGRNFIRIHLRKALSIPLAACTPF